MGVILTPILSSTAGTAKAYNPGIADTYSWVPIEGEALGRPMYARASYVTNFSDMSIYLSASELSIGAVTIKDNNSGLNADVVNIPGYGAGLQVLTQDLESTIDDVTIGDKEGNFAKVDSSLSALKVKVVNSDGISISGNVIISNIVGVSSTNLPVTILNPTTSINVYTNNNTLAVSGTVTVSNPVTSVTAVVDTTKGFPITYADTSFIDAFGRLRISEPITLVDAKHLYDKLPLLFNEKLSGTATSTFSANDSMVVMATDAQNSYVIRQSRYHFNYQPGKSLQAYFTGKIHPQAGITKRIGLYQSLSSSPTTPTDGIYLEVTQNGPTFNIVKTQGTPLTMSFPQSAWNVDKLDGTGISGVTIALSAAQIFVVDYEWLSLGRVRFGFMQSGKVHYAHYVNHINDLDRPYITSPNQPIRYEIIQTGTSPGELFHICSTVMIEGGEENVGKPIALSDGKVTDVELTRAKALLGVRLKPAAHDSTVVLKAVEVINLGGAPGRFEVILNPTYISTPFTWTDTENAAVQFSTGGAFVSGGYVLYKGCLPGGVGGTSTGTVLPLIGEITKLGISIDDTPDVIVLAGRSFADNAKTDMAGVMNLLERS